MRVAVLGLGSIGLRHAGNLLALGQEVVGFDPDPKRCEALKESGGASAASRAEALDDVSAAVIASPNAAHLDDIAAVISRGLHLFVEKPPAHSAEGLRPLVSRAREAALVFFTGVNLRFSPVVRAGRECIQSGALGDPLWAQFVASSWLPDWRPGQDHMAGYTADPRTGGVLFDYFHEFDLAAHLLGRADPVAAAARTTGLVSIPADDCADILLRHEGGVQSSIHVDYVSRVRLRHALVCGTEGLLRLDINDRTLEHTPAGGDRRVTGFDGNFSNDYVTEMRSFLACVRGEESPLCDGREGLSVLETVVATRNMCGLPS
ncbi:MAG: Gfo/Idh/MocA family protein [Planctomycetota bacterium]